MKSVELKTSLLLYAVTDRAWLGKNFCCETLSDAVFQAIEGGADDYIMKPFDEDIVATKLTILGLL